LNKKVNFTAPGRVNSKQAYSLLVGALAGEGIAISDRGDTLVVMRARASQRSWIPIVKNLPPLQPEQMVTYVLSLKHLSAQDVLKRVRVLLSRNREMISRSKHELVITDWISSLHRAKSVIAELDHE
jgi:general secretion pathway protein D